MNGSRSQTVAIPFSEAARDALYRIYRADAKLYSRDDDIAKLYTAYEQRRNRRLVLLVGQPGTGKTALAHTLRERVDADGGFFLVGRYDGMEHPEPFSPWIQAIRQLIIQLNRRGDSKLLARIKAAIAEKLGKAELSALVHLIPDLREWAPAEMAPGSKSSTSTDESRNAGARLSFLATFGKLLRAVCTEEFPPTIWFLDDLQNAVKEALEVVKLLAVDNTISNILPIIAFRPVHAQHPSSLMLQVLERAGTTMVPVLPTPLDEGGIYEWLQDYTDTFQLSSTKTLSLANVIQKGTEGNALSVSLCLQIMKLNPEIVRETGGTPLQAGGTVKDLFSLLFQMMSGNAQQALRTASAMGVVLDYESLIRIVPNYLSEALAEAERRGILLFLSHSALNIGGSSSAIYQSENETADPMFGKVRDPITGVYAFRNTTYKEMVYESIGREEAKKVHTAIGNVFRNNIVAAGVFSTVAHLSLGAELLSPKGLEELCKLSGNAGRYAVQWSAFGIAVGYLDQGIQLLDEKQKWKSLYPLSMELYFASAESYSALQLWGLMDKRLTEVLSKAKNAADKLRAKIIQIKASVNRNEHNEALALGTKVLQKLHDPIKKGSLEAEFKSVRKHLEGKSEERILSMPSIDIDDIQKMRTMEILNHMIASAMLVQCALVPVLSCRMLKLTLKQGLTASSPVGFCLYGVSQCQEGSIDDGTWIGEVGAELAEMLDDVETKGRAMTIHCGLLGLYSTSWSHRRAKLQDASRMCSEGNDAQFSVINRLLTAVSIFASSTQLSDVIEFMKPTYHLLNKKHHDVLVRVMRPFFQMALNLMGAAPETNPTILAGSVMNEDEEISYAKESENNKAEYCIYLCQTMLALLLHRFHRARELMEKCLSVAGKHQDMLLLPLKATEHFYNALTAIAMIWYLERHKERDKKENSKKQRAKLMATAESCLEKLQTLGQFVPDDVNQKVFAIRAELYALNGKVDLAVNYFHKSMSHSAEHGAIGDRAFVCERAGLALRFCGRDDQALDFLEDCCSLYRDWGALIKVNHVKGNVIPQAIYEWEEDR